MSTTTTTTITTNNIQTIKRQWLLADIDEKSACEKRVKVVYELLFTYEFKQVEIVDLLETSKGYISKLAKISKFMHSKGITLREFTQTINSAKEVNIEVLYNLVKRDCDKKQFLSVDKSIFLDKSMNDAPLSSFSAKKGSRKQVEKNGEKDKVFVDSNNMVDIYHNNKHYRIPLDILNNYLVK